MLTLEEYTEQSIIVLTPTDELLTADAVQEVCACTDTAAARQVIIDFKNVRSLVSGSLYPHAEPIKPLLTLNQKLQTEERRMVLCNLSSEIAEVFRITRINQILEVQPDLAKALSNASGVSS